MNLMPLVPLSARENGRDAPRLSFRYTACASTVAADRPHSAVLRSLLPCTRSHVNSDPGSFTAWTYTSRNQDKILGFFHTLPETTFTTRHRSIFNDRRVLIREVTKNFSDLYIWSIVGGVGITTDVMHCTKMKYYCDDRHKEEEPLVMDQWIKYTQLREK